MKLSSLCWKRAFYMEIEKEQIMEKLTEQEVIRRQKMEDLRAMGIEPSGMHIREHTNPEKYVQHMKTVRRKNWKKKI